jgi:hypothetical protein
VAEAAGKIQGRLEKLELRATQLALAGFSHKRENIDRENFFLFTSSFLFRFLFLSFLIFDSWWEDEAERKKILHMADLRTGRSR